MFERLALLLVLGWSGQASAQDCPDFFRFVDFGIEDSTGTFSRGGPLLRAESLEGRPLLFRDQTECRTVRDIAADGHGNPIPVVTRVYYDPENTGMDLTELSVSFAVDTAATTKLSAQSHVAQVDLVGATLTRGDNFLCAHATDSTSVSCQVVSPYPGNLALVVYCEDDLCTMPALAMNERMQISASWPMAQDVHKDTSALGQDIHAKVRGIYQFLDPLM